MSFYAGRVSFSRFFAVGDAPVSVDDTTLATLAEHAFAESHGAPEPIEAGWTTGEHLFDTTFSYDKNAFGGMLLFALRVDTHRVPSEVKQAYRRMHEQAAAADNPSGFASRQQKRDAAEHTDRQLHDELAAGRYRRSRTVPVLWDLQERVVYVGAAGNVVAEQLARLFRTSFNIDLESMSAGSLSSHLLRERGRGRDYEDLRPAAFTAPPAEARLAGDDADAGVPRDLNVPFVPWTANSIDTKDFLGNEFLIWLWSVAETGEGIVSVRIGERDADIAVMLDRSVEMHCAWSVRGRMTLAADGPTRLPEAGEALHYGKWPRKAGLIIADTQSHEQWTLSLQADRWAVSGATLPEVEQASSPRELIEQRLLLVRRLAGTLDALLDRYLEERVSGSWPTRRQKLRQWIDERRKGPARQPLQVEAAVAESSAATATSGEAARSNAGLALAR